MCCALSSKSTPNAGHHGKIAYESLRVATEDLEVRLELRYHRPGAYHQLLQFLRHRRYHLLLVHVLKVVDVATLRRLAHAQTVAESLPSVEVERIFRLVHVTAENQRAGDDRPSPPLSGFAVDHGHVVLVSYSNMSQEKDTSQEGSHVVANREEYVQRRRMVVRPRVVFNLPLREMGTRHLVVELAVIIFASAEVVDAEVARVVLLQEPRHLKRLSFLPIRF